MTPAREFWSRKRNLPAPPHAVFEHLTDPTRNTIRTWLHLLDDEVAPMVLESREPEYVVWSSIWPQRPDARIRFDLPPGGRGTDLRWTLTVDGAAPEEDSIRQMRKRINVLINANLRSTYGQ